MRSLLIVVIALLLASCRKGDGSPARANPGAALRLTLTYADRQPNPAANPTGVYWEGERLWVWSDSHRVQRSYARAEGGFRAGPLREGPAGTQRCLVGRARLSGDTYCVGRYQNGGLVAFAQGANEVRAFGALPARAGFRDLVLLHELGLVGVLDAVSDELALLDRTGRLVGRSPLGPASYRIGSAGGDRIFVLSGEAPQLRVLQVAADGSTRALAHLARHAPLRDAHYDELDQLLWIAGPEDHEVRRQHGPIEKLGSELVALDGLALSNGEIRVRERFNLTARSLADPTRLTASAGQVFVSLTGSDRLARLSRAAGGWQFAATPTGLGPAGLSSEGGSLAVAARLDDRVYVYDARAGQAGPPQVITIDDRPRESARDLGERLFYGALLWSQARQRPFTCNSCHWDTESDRRKHPGRGETRLEQTRPLGGVAALAPVFTPGQARTLEDAVDGLIRVLDDAYWRDREFREPAIELRVKGGGLRRLGPRETRQALSAFLAALPVSPGPYLRVEEPELRALVTRGAQLFLADCADCHVARAESGRPGARSAAALVDAVQRQPLVFGATGFAHAGAGPSFTEMGNRISPLMGLARGGPYFASGSAPDLRAVLASFARARPSVHAAGQRGVYDTQQIAALEAFLHAL